MKADKAIIFRNNMYLLCQVLEIRLVCG